MTEAEILSPFSFLKILAQVRVLNITAIHFNRVNETANSQSLSEFSCPESDTPEQFLCSRTRKSMIYPMLDQNSDQLTDIEAIIAQKYKKTG